MAEEKTTESLLRQCADAGMRRTAALEACLRVLAEAPRPLTLQDIPKSPAFKANADPATVYRLIQRLEERRIVRRIGFHSRAAHYCLRQQHHHDYLVCRDCGSVEVLDITCPVAHLEKQISTESGYADIDHELEFYGRCAECQ